MDGLLALYIYLLTGLARLSRPLSVIGFGEYREWHPGEKLKILLVGYNGARNTGADVRVAALARQLKEIFDPDKIEITVMALDTENLSGYFDPDVNLYKFTTVFPLSPYIDYLSFFFHKKWRYPKKDIISLMVKMSDDSLGSSEKHAIHKKVTTDDRKRLLRGAGKCRDILARMGIPKEETFPGNHTTSMSGCTLYPYPSG